MDGRGGRGRGSEKTVERRESEGKAETKNWGWGGEMGEVVLTSGDSPFLRVLGLLPHFPGPQSYYGVPGASDVGKPSALNSLLRRGAPIFYLMGSHLGPTLLV